MRLFAVIAILLFSPLQHFGQQITISGKVLSNTDEPIEGVNIVQVNTQKGAVSDVNGLFTLTLNGSKSDSVGILFSHIAYQTKTLWVTTSQPQITVRLQGKIEVLNAVNVASDRELSPDAGITKLNPKAAQELPTPFRDFNKILSTLPGVVSNNELSSSYSVRGGNYDENLIYVNDMPIYRPQLVTNGQQEGLSFINPDLVKSVAFSAGGWQPKYGDKLSSVLNVEYKTPSQFGASASIGLLGGSLHIEGGAPDKRVNYAFGARHKSSRYLLNTLETQGQYLPKFSDFQSIININLSKDISKKRTSISILSGYARNRYFVEPESRETEFGNFNQSLRLFVAFQGTEVLEYDTYQTGIKLKHRLTDSWNTQLVVSGVYATEREFTDVEGGYRLCDVDKNLSSATFNDCVFIRGIGTNYDYGRNNLQSEIYFVENRNEILLGEGTLEFGLGYSRQLIEDQLQEYDFTDSAGYVIQLNAVQAENTLSSEQYTGYVQHHLPLSKSVSTTFGVRFNYWTLNEQLLTSPRWQMTIKPRSVRNTTLTAAIGLYQQPPFFRELRNFDGVVNRDLKAQRALHFIGGLEYPITWWGRAFMLSSQLYYKRLSNVVPYEVDNVKIRYYANNNAKGFATGIDTRISGEFIKGVESWFSLGILNVREDVAGDGQGFIRRPTDQRLNLGVFFQDHFPGNPNMRVSLNLLYGSGLPFGPPQNFTERNKFNGDAYIRVDVGFSRIFELTKGDRPIQLIIGAEVLNLLGTDNAISYTWISDVNRNQFAVPNSLSARFLNIRATIQI